MFLSLATNVALRSQPSADSPAHELATLRIAEGYQVNLFASEPAVVKPIQMQFDLQGRLWVLCTTAYPQIKPGEKADDRVVILEDADGDGRAEKSTVFAAGLMIPTGLALGHGGVYIGQGTELLHLKDTDNDGKADQTRTVLSGFGTGDSHQNINSFTWSPGGELLFCQGHNIYSKIETEDGIKRLDRAGVWRFRPATYQLDSFFHQSNGPLNPWGVVFDSWGQPFLVDGCCIGIFYLLPVMVPNKPEEKYPHLWLGKKICGADLLSGAPYSDEEQGILVGGTFFNNSVGRWRLTEDGSGFAATELPPLIESTNRSFRVVDVKVGPDGAVYVADWYNPIIGHYQHSFRHPDRDKIHGRIWRVTKKDRPLANKPKLVDISLAQLLNHLKAPENYTRQQTRRALAEIPPQRLVPALQEWFHDLKPKDPQYEHHLLEVLMVYESLDIVERGVLVRLLEAEDFRARAYATRVLGRWHSQIDTAMDLLAERTQDTHPRVRLEAVVALNSIPSGQAMEIALRAVDLPMDRFLDYALRQAVRGLKRHWAPVFASGKLRLDDSPPAEPVRGRSARKEASVTPGEFGVETGGRAARAPAEQAVQKRLEFLVRADSSPDTLRSVVELLKRESLSKATRAGLLTTLAEVGGPNELGLVFHAGSYQVAGVYDPELHARLLPALAAAERQRKARPPGNLVEGLNTLLQHADEALRAEALKLAGTWKLESLRSKMESVVESPGSGDPLLKAALDGIASLSGEKSREFLTNIGRKAQSEKIRLAAIGGLAAVDARLAAAEAAEAFARGSGGVGPEELMAAFLQRAGGADALAAALERQAPTTDIAKLALRYLNSIGRQETRLDGVLRRAVGLDSENRPLDEMELKALVAEVRTLGERSKGEAIFRRPDLGCLTCHVVGNEGGRIGPDLNSIGTGQPLDFIIGAILNPNKEVKEGYLAYEITTKDGELLQGYKVRESNEGMVLRDVAQNQELRLRAENIAKQRLVGSLMPSGLVSSLTRAELRDLLRYLSELGTP